MHFGEVGMRKEPTWARNVATLMACSWRATKTKGGAGGGAMRQRSHGPMHLQLAETSIRLSTAKKMFIMTVSACHIPPRAKFEKWGDKSSSKQS
jgi:hypothetical protein